MGVGGQRHTSYPLRPGKKPDIYCSGVWVVSKATLEGREEEKIFFFHRSSNPEPCSQ
jgi:hypothetical protein